MQETQVVAVLLAPLATLATVIVGFLYNNSRMSDLRSDLGGRMSDLRSELKDLVQAESSASNARMDALTAHMRRIEDMLLGKFAELDTRLSRIESHLNLN